MSKVQSKKAKVAVAKGGQTKPRRVPKYEQARLALDVVHGFTDQRLVKPAKELILDFFAADLH